VGNFFSRATELKSLRAAWQRIRANGSVSRSQETRTAIEVFEREVERNLRKIQWLLRDRKFKFEPQHGVLRKNSSGGKRGIVMASVHNRVVERAWLDCLQSHSNCVRSVNSQPTSVGGVPNRSVPHGLKLVKDAFAAGKRFYVRSDISGFFDHIPKAAVITRIADDIDDPGFIETLTAATTVVLKNEEALGDDRSVFPTDEEGVAQGSPLSPLFGNILLYDFDREFNNRGIVCVRFVDDFVLLADDDRSVSRAFASARSLLLGMGLNCHDPFAANTNVEKAGHGKVDDGFVFLGYDIRPGLYQPSRKARQALCKAIDDHIRFGRYAITDVKSAGNSFASRQRYAQTLVLLDKVVHGWGDAFAYSNAPNTLETLDMEISRKLDTFGGWFARQVKDQDWKKKRRLGGVGLLVDIQPKNLDDVPFTLDPGARFVRSARTVTISTDGSTVARGRRRGKDQGPGGWAFVVHDTNKEQCGRTHSATNNQMELRAVVEAIRSIDPKSSIVIRTDSQYVSAAINNGALIKSNTALWSEYRELAKSRRIKVVWVKGHAGDSYNERADSLASQQAQVAKAEGAVARQLASDAQSQGASVARTADPL
jgi:RNA-directed DNA polymerase